MKSCCLLILGALTAPAASIVIGTANLNNCITFGCPVFFGLTTYQQVYSSSAFPAQPISISGLTFYKFLGDTPAGGDFTFSLSTTSKPVGGLDTVFANNLGPDNQVFFSGPLAGPVGASFTVSGGPFLYNPALGNLLLTIGVAGATDEDLFVDAQSSATDFSRMYDGYLDTANVGLVTGFEVVPEPGMLLLTGSGLLLLLVGRPLWAARGPRPRFKVPTP